MSVGGVTIPALVLAGSRGPSDPVAAYAGIGHKALVPVDGTPMLVRVIDALRASSSVGKIAVAIEPEAPVATLGELPVTWLAAAGSPSRSVGAAMEALGTPLLVTTADHALLRPEWVERFLSDAPADADVVAAVARREIVQAASPETRRTYLRFADAQVSGCNMFLLRTPAAAGIVTLWQQVEANRKHPLRVLRLLGPFAVLRYVLGWLTVSAAVHRLGKIAGCRAALVELPFGEAAIDVDKPSDLVLADAILKKRSA